MAFTERNNASDAARSALAEALGDNEVAVNDKTNKAIAFVNWGIPRKNGGMFRGSKGFPIFQNPEYPNPEEDALIELCRKNNGYVEVTMKCRICLNEKRPEGYVPSIDDLQLD